MLKVAASPLQIETVLSTLLHQYARHYPNVQVKLIEATGVETLTMLERGEIHLGVCLFQSVQAGDRHFGNHPMPPVELLAACHPSFQLEGGENIDVTRVASYPLLLLNSSFQVRKTFDAVCRLARLKPNITIRVARRIALALGDPETREYRNLYEIQTESEGRRRRKRTGHEQRWQGCHREPADGQC